MINYNPTTGEIYKEFPDLKKEDLEKVLADSRIGFRKWQAIPFDKRMRIIEKWSWLIEEHTEDIAKIMAEEGGKPLDQSRAEIARIFDNAHGYMASARTLYGQSLPFGTEAKCYKDLVVTVHEPLGVILCVPAFNFPATVYGHKVCAALCAGNAVILKPASDTPCSSVYMTELLYEAGVPRETIQCVVGAGAEIGDTLAGDPRVNGVMLTGSTRVGLHIAEICAKQLKPYCLELGGNDALVIMDDFDVDEAVKEAMAGRAGNAGQICCSSKRFIVQNTVRKEFTEKLADALSKMKIGNPLEDGVEVGPIINRRAADRIMSQIEHAVSQGATRFSGGVQDGNFISPCVLSDVPLTADVAHSEEIFGPVFPVIGFDTLEEAIAIANDSQYGLSSGILTRDIKAGMKFAMEVDAGAAVIGGNGNYRLAMQPFGGGHKMSGVGSEGGMYTLSELTKVKTIAIKNVIE